MLRKLTVFAALCLITSPALAPVATAVDGVLSYDSAAVRPVYLRAFDLEAGARITGAELFLNDRGALPSRVFVVQSDAKGNPDWDTAVSTGVSLIAVDDDLLNLDLELGPLVKAGRVWLAVEFSQGSESVAEGLGGGPAMGYQARPSVLGSQLLSPDGGQSYDYLSPALTLAMELEVESTDASDAGSANSMLRTGPQPSSATRLVAAPNPFNPRTELFFELPANGGVKLVLYDVRGRRVRTLIDGYRSAGAQSVIWDGRDELGSPVASGTLYARLRGPGIEQTTRLVLLR